MTRMVGIWRAARATLLTVLTVVVVIVGVIVYGGLRIWILARDLWAGFYREG